MEKEPVPCALCNRKVPLSTHHLIPVSMHKRTSFKTRFTKEELGATIEVCRPCHDAIHRHVEEPELGRDFNSLELLKSHPEIAKFSAWVAKKEKHSFRPAKK